MNSTENSEERNNKKFDLKKGKENTVNSLFEVEHFLKNFKSVLKGVKLYNTFKK